MKLELKLEEILGIVNSLKYCAFRRDLILDNETNEKNRGIIKAVIKQEEDLARKLLKMVAEEKKENNS
jgi:hypothetical protein